MVQIEPLSDLRNKFTEIEAVKKIIAETFFVRSYKTYFVFAETCFRCPRNLRKRVNRVDKRTGLFGVVCCEKPLRSVAHGGDKLPERRIPVG